MRMVSPSEQSHATIRQWSPVLRIILLALAMRLVFVLAVPPGPLSGDAKEYDGLAVRLAQGKGYVTESGEPTAFRPPGYPVVLAAIYLSTGPHLVGVRIVQAFLGAGICVLVYLIARRCFTPAVATFSGYLCSVYPPLVLNTSEIMSEPVFTFGLLLGIWRLLVATKPMQFLLAGLVLGLALLTKPMLVFFFPLLFLWIWLNARVLAVLRIMLISTGMLLVVSPWTLRNYVHFHAVVPLATLGGLALYNSYVVPDKGLGFNSLEGLGAEYTAISQEAERDAYLVKRTLEYIQTHPLQVLRAIPKKVLLLFYPFDGYWYALSLGSKYNIFWGLVFCFAVLGGLVPSKDPDSTRLLLLLFLSFLSAAVVFYGSPRFRLPIEPLLVSLAANGFMGLSQRNKLAIAGIILVNLAAFLLFRYFTFQEWFDALKAWP